MGDFETCELCEGTGSIIAEKPTNVPAGIKTFVMEARYAAGLPLWNPADSHVAQDKSRGGPDWTAFLGLDDGQVVEFGDDADEDFEDPEWD